MSKYQCVHCNKFYDKLLPICPACKGEVVDVKKTSYIKRINQLTNNKTSLRDFNVMKISLFLSIIILIFLIVVTILNFQVFIDNYILVILIILFDMYYIFKSFRNYKTSLKVQEILKEYYDKYNEKLL